MSGPASVSASVVLDPLAWLAHHFPDLPAPSPDMSFPDLARLVSAVSARRGQQELELRRLGLMADFLDAHLANATGRALSQAFDVPFVPAAIPAAVGDGDRLSGGPADFPRACVPCSPRPSAVAPVTPSVMAPGSTTIMAPGTPSMVAPGRRLSLASSAPPSPSPSVASAPVTPGRGQLPGSGSVPGPSSRRTSGASVPAAPRSRTRTAVVASTSEPPVGFDVASHSTWPETAPSDWCRACWPEVRGMRFSRRHDAGEGGRRCRLGVTPVLQLPETLFGCPWGPAKPFRSPARAAGRMAVPASVESSSTPLTLRPGADLDAAQAAGVGPAPGGTSASSGQACVSTPAVGARTQTASLSVSASQDLPAQSEEAAAAGQVAGVGGGSGQRLGSLESGSFAAERGSGSASDGAAPDLHPFDGEAAAGSAGAEAAPSSSAAPSPGAGLADPAAQSSAAACLAPTTVSAVAPEASASPAVLPNLGVEGF